MSLHTPSGRWRLGLLLAVSTALLWASLPVVLKVALEQLDPITLTWTRFAFAAVVVGAWLAARGDLRQLAVLPRRSWAMLFFAGVMLIGNYVFYLLGLKYTSPANAQLLIQGAPLLMALGGVVIFRERYNAWQWIGLLTIALGLILFFSDQLAKPAPQGSRYVLGSGLVAVASFVWAGYAMVQKQLLQRLSSAAIMFSIYVTATCLLLPVAHPATVLRLDSMHLVALSYCALNTLAAYGAFAEALVHWEASRVSVILALSPLLTMATVAGTHAIAPALVRSEQIAWAGWLGAALVICGSALTSLMRRPSRS